MNLKFEIDIKEIIYHMNNSNITSIAILCNKNVRVKVKNKNAQVIPLGNIVSNKDISAVVKDMTSKKIFSIEKDENQIGVLFCNGSKILFNADTKSPSCFFTN